MLPRLVSIQGFIHGGLDYQQLTGGQFSRPAGSSFVGGRQIERIYLFVAAAYLVQRQTLVGKEADGCEKNGEAGF